MKIIKNLGQILRKLNNAPSCKNYSTHGANPKPQGNPPKNPRK